MPREVCLSNVGEKQGRSGLCSSDRRRLTGDEVRLPFCHSERRGLWRRRPLTDDSHCETPPEGSSDSRLLAHCNMDQQSSSHCFGLFLGMQEKGLVSFVVDYEFAAISRPMKEFVSKYKGNYTFYTILPMHEINFYAMKIDFLTLNYTEPIYWSQEN
ncbi:hypothetical protein SESBI_01395 [Sesbania bispinosa]|nr:hypothetical protein SESBI_01395 [Sesbania bispinosa]